MHYMRNALWALLVIVVVDVFYFAEGYSNTKSVRVLSEPNDDSVDDVEAPRRAIERPGGVPERDAEWKWGNNRRPSQAPQARSDRLAQANEYVEVEWDGLSCPKGATGAFPFAADCKKFYNCWKGRGMLSMCAPGTLFNSVTLECDYPAKALCYTRSSNGGKPSGNLQDATAAGSQDNPRLIAPSRPIHYSHSPQYHSPGTHSHSPGPDNYRGHSAAYHQGREPPHAHRHHHHNHDETFQHSEAYHRQHGQYGSNVNRKTANTSPTQSGTVHSGVQPPVSNGQLPLDLVPPQPPSQIVPMYPPLSSGNSDSFQRIPTQGSGPSPALNNEPYTPSSGFPAYPGSNFYNQSGVSSVDSYGQRVDNSYTQVGGYQPTVNRGSSNNDGPADETDIPIDPVVESDNFGIETEGAFRGTTYEFKDGKLYLVIPAPGSLIGGQDSEVTSRQIPSARNPYNTDTLEVGQEQDRTDIFSENADPDTHIDSYQGTNSDRHETVVSSTSSQSSYVAGAAVTKTNSYQSGGSNINTNPTARPQPNFSHRGSPGVVQPFPVYPGRKTQNSNTGYGQVGGSNHNEYQSHIPDSDYDSPKGPESDSLHRDEDGQHAVDDAFPSQNNQRGSIKHQSSSTGYDQQSSSSGYHHRTSNGEYGTQRSANGGYRQQPSRNDPTPGGFDRDPTRGGYGSQPASGSYYQQLPSDTYSQQSSSNSYNQQSSSDIYTQQPLSSSYHQRPSSGSQQYSPNGDRQRPSGNTYGQRPSTGTYNSPGSQQPPYNQQPSRTGYAEPPSNDYSRQPLNGYGQPPVGNPNPNYQNGFSDPGKSHLTSASKPSTGPTGDLNQIPEDKCPAGFSGLTAHSNPTKFLSCSNGRAFVMDCGPGTWFDESSQLCGFPPVNSPSHHKPQQEGYVGQHGLSGDAEEVAGKTRSY